MNMKNYLLGAVAAAGLALAPAAANAAQYITDLVYSQDGLNGTPFGTVTVTDVGSGSGAYVDVLVQLLPPVTNFVDTGAHYKFAFNLVDTTNSSVVLINPNLNINAAGNSDGYTFLQNGDYDQAPFKNFTEAIAYSSSGNNISPPTFEFHVTNANGISVLGAGNHFTSTQPNFSGGQNPHPLADDLGFQGGWWFAADVFYPNNPGTSPTFTAAGRDYCTVGLDCGPGVPEPATWAMMLMGFGGMGAVLRRNRRQARMAFA